MPFWLSSDDETRFMIRWKIAFLVYLWRYCKKITRILSSTVYYYLKPLIVFNTEFALLLLSKSSVKKKSCHVFTDGTTLVLNEKQSRATGNRIIVNTDSEKLPVFTERKLVLENIGWTVWKLKPLLNEEVYPVRLPVSSERKCCSRAGWRMEDSSLDNTSAYLLTTCVCW